MTTEQRLKSHLREIPRSDCLRLLSGRTMGRIVFNDADGPLLIPVNYVVDGNSVLIATSAFGSLAQNFQRGQVAFEVDQIDDSSGSGWSVLVRGSAEYVPYDELPQQLTARPDPWAEGTRAFFLRISAREVTGRRLIPA